MSSNLADSIKRGLEDAIAYARGDKSKGRVVEQTKVTRYVLSVKDSKIVMDLLDAKGD